MTAAVGHQISRRVFKLVFADDTELAGAQVRMRSLSVDDLLTLTEAVDAAAHATGQAEQIRQLAPVLDVMAGGLLDWNLTDGGDPIPATRAGLGLLEIPDVTRLAREWMTAAAGVPDPLGGPSTPGPTAPEVSLPMESLPVSPPS